MAAGSSAPCEGMYSKLIDETYDELSARAEGGAAAHPVFPVRIMPLPSEPGRYRLATICLAALCAILLISVIAVSAQNKSKPQGDSTATIQKQMQEANISSFTATINKLQQEKTDLQKAKDDLQREKDDLQKRVNSLQEQTNGLQKEKEDLQREKEDLQREKIDLLAKLAIMTVTNAPEVIKPTTETPIVCPVDWYLFNSSCYFISRTRRDWPESQSFCQSKGGHLAIIHTAEEQTFLWNLLPRAHWNAFWFGITDKDTEDQWQWVDGTPLVGGFWEVGEPNNHINEDCGYIVKTEVLERVAIRSWYDAPCSMDCRYICEKEMGPGASTAMPH